MNNQNIVSQPVPDFGALLESVKENGRLMRESAERYQKEWVEREKKREKERQEREAKLEKEKQEREEAEKKRYEQWEADRQAFKDRMDKISADTNKSIKEMREVFTHSNVDHVSVATNEDFVKSLKMLFAMRT